MTYNDIVTSVLRRRFDEGSRDEAKRWVRDREVRIWQHAEWPIKNSVQLGLTVVSGTATVGLPTGMPWPSEGITIWDNYGNQLDYLDPHDFYAAYGASPSSPVTNSAPTAWTLVTDPTATGALVFRVGPTPATSTTFTVQGWNLPIKRTGASTWTIGTMSLDTDLPWWPDDHHYFIVPGAQALGLKLENDPTWPPLEDEFKSGLDGLYKMMFPTGRDEFEQWGDYWSPGDYWGASQWR